MGRGANAPFSADGIAVPVQCSRPLGDARAENVALDIRDTLPWAAYGHLISVEQDAAVLRRAPHLPSEVFDARPARWWALHVAVAIVHAAGSCRL